MALPILFFLSGISALVYQVVWQRLLSAVFGVTVYATSTVLASFMAGLALGSALGGRLADRLKRPLLGFAAVEAGVALLAAAIPGGLSIVSDLYVAAQRSVGADTPLLALVRAGCSAALLLLPTTLMGATLPLVVASSRTAGHALRGRIALLYGVNTLGAFTGALSAGYVLIGRFGLRATTYLAAAVNVLVALGALWLAAREETRAAATPTGAHREPGASSLTPIQARLLLGAFAVSGSVALGLEVVWFRMLTAYLPTTTYAFTTMLATVLAGIGMGGALAARAGAPAAGELRRVGLLLAATGALSVFSANALARTYAAGWRTSGVIQACVLALFPATLVMGLAYPRGLALWAGASSGVGRRIGVFSAANLAGGIAGALVAGFMLIPRLGTRGSLVVLAALSLAGGAALAFAGAVPRSASGRTALASLLAVFVASAATLPDAFSAALAKRHRGDAELWREESVQATVAVHRRGDGERVLYIDGMHQANDSPAMRSVHRRIGLLPLLLHPAPRRALVIGLAGGATPGAMALAQDVQLDIVELSEAVVRGSSFFRHVNGDLLQRRNVELRIGDGRNHLLTTRERYDIVTADLIQPFHAGAGLLYSTEYFRLCRSVLSDGGLMLQWIGHPPEQQYKLILRSFLEVFPHTTLWAESFLVGSTRPVRVSESAFERFRGERPELRAALQDVGISDFDSLLALYDAGPDQLRRFAGVGPLLTDDRPLVEYYRSLEGSSAPPDLTALGPPDASALRTP